jgi:hypothetical protein
MKKRYFTLKNGAFYPRIQSILAFFLGYFWWFYFVRNCGRRWENKMWEVCVKILRWVCVSHLLALSARVVARRDRPATSCRAFLLRTLPPPPKIWMSPKTQSIRKNPDNPFSYIVLVSFKSSGGSVPGESSPALHEGGGPPPPPPPPKDPKDQKQ